MGISPSDIPIDTSGANADRWHVHFSDELDGHVAGCFLERGKTVTPVDGRRLRRVAGAMGSMLIGAMRVEGGEPLELGDCSELKPKPAAVEAPAPEPEPDPAATGRPAKSGSDDGLSADLADMERAVTEPAPAPAEASKHDAAPEVSAPDTDPTKQHGKNKRK